VLSRSATLEDVASLLWEAQVSVPTTPKRPAGTPLAATFSALAARAATDLASFGRSTDLLRHEASSVLGTFADAMLGSGQGPLHDRVAGALGRPEAADTLRCAMVLLADHELNASTFAARVTVSTGASLAAGTLAGLAALNGPLHGSASSAVAALAADIEVDGSVEESLRDWLGEGRVVPGFGHRLYPDGDVRALELLSRLDVPPAYAELAEAGEYLTGERPNIDFALAALAAAYGLPAGASLTIFALARCVGWLAHMLEQAASGQLIRPRARYVGPVVGTE
jgi:citrate synthase